MREVHFSFIAILPSLFLNSHNICLKILNHFQNILVFLVEYYYYRDFTCAPRVFKLIFARRKLGFVSAFLWFFGQTMTHSLSFNFKYLIESFIDDDIIFVSNCIAPKPTKGQFEILAIINYF